MHMNTGLSTLPIIIIGAACSMPAIAEPEAPGACVIWEHAKGLLPSVPSLKAWELEPEAAPWEGRDKHGSAVLGDTMWFFGGRDYTTVPDATFYNDVWYTENGSMWTRAIEHAAWSPRFVFGAAAFDEKIWIMGGSDGNTPRNDVYSSPDGINWTEVTAGAQWSARTYLGTVVFNNQMWVMGGASSPGGVSTVMNDVWYSDDGKDWTRATANAAWPARYNTDVVVFQNKIWVIGGYDGNSVKYRDVWYSENGNMWTQATATAPWGARLDQSVAVYDNRLWLTGGYPGSKDVWYSEDGASWFEGEKPAWDGLLGHTSHAFGGRLYLLGGTTEDGGFSSQIWTYESGGGSIGCGVSNSLHRGASPFGDMVLLSAALLLLSAFAKAIFPPHVD